MVGVSITARDLLAKSIEPITYIVDDLIPEGLLLLAGPSKIGKSYLVNQLSLAVASGRPFLGRSVTEGSVLYYALEDGERRLQDRLRQQAPDAHGLHRITYNTEAPRLGDGLAEAIETWRAGTPDGRLVVIDTMINVAGGPRGGRDGYDHWSEVLTEPRQLARDLKLGIILVHHARKSGKAGEVDADMLDGVHGSVALVAMSDAIYILRRDRTSSVARLGVSGRDVREAVYKIQRDDATMTWHPASDALPEELATATGRQQDVIRLLAQGPLRNAEVAARLGLSPSNVNQILRRAVDDGFVVHTERGPYELHDDTARLLAEAGSAEPTQPTELNEEAEEFDFGL